MRHLKTLRVVTHMITQSERETLVNRLAVIPAFSDRQDAKIMAEILIWRMWGCSCGRGGQMEQSMKVAFYFGVWDEHKGHYLRDPAGQTYHLRLQEDFPMSDQSIDGGLLPPMLPEEEGRASLAQINGWTVLSFWDRSGDPRGKSNSNFFVKGRLGFAEMVEKSKYYFPHIWARFCFEVKEFIP